MTRPTSRVVLCALILAITFAGCSLPGKSATRAKQSYLLQGPVNLAAVNAANARPCMSLRVSTPAAAPGFDTNFMAYMTDPPRLDYFAYHQWIDTPSRMLAAVMEAGLDRSGVVGTVVSGSADVRADIRLDAELLELQQDFNGKSSTVDLVIKVRLIEVSTRSLLDSKTFSYTEKAAGADPEAGVTAANAAVKQFVPDLIAFTGQALARYTCSSTD